MTKLSCNACGDCCNEIELVAVVKLDDGTFRRFYSDGSSDVFDPSATEEG